MEAIRSVLPEDPETVCSFDRGRFECRKILGRFGHRFPPRDRQCYPHGYGAKCASPYAAIARERGFKAFKLPFMGIIRPALQPGSPREGIATAIGDHVAVSSVFD